jgi:2-dehydro-3-deoxyglucarate aldolase
MQIPHPSVAEIMGQAGYEWVAVDLEHGSVSVAQLPDLFRALELGGTLPLARVSEGAAKEVKQALDAGAGGIIVPMIENAPQLIAVRDACRWPPAGRRGVGFSRANLFGKHFGSYREEAQAPLIVAMIEHAKAVESLPEIVSVAGLDALLVGPYDLSASLGHTGEFDHPVFKTAMARIRAEADARGLPCGIHVVAPSRKELQNRISEGYRFIAYSIDAVMLLDAAQFANS